LLTASLWLIDAETPVPGVWTLLPVVATLLLLLAGSEERNPVTRLLGSRPLVRIGDWSYSIYLWHWPCIVFATLLWPDRSHVGLLAAALSLAPAVASYNWVEQPMRRLELPSRRRLVTVVAAVVLSPMLAAGALGSVAADFWTPRYTSGEMPIANHGGIGQEAFYRYLRRTSFACPRQDLRKRSPTWAGVLRCRQSKPDSNVTVALIGDSH